MRRALTPLALALSLVAMVLAAPAATAAPRVDVANDQQTAAIDPTYLTSLRLSGRGFQSVPRGFGGIYVLFGTVSGNWRPSSGGSGSMLYVPDSQARSNAGYQRFVSFPGSDTSGEANGGTIDGSGRWSTSIQVPGATFRAVDSSGRVRTVDCRRVTCGVITIGAHGVRNRANETFTPVRVTSLYGAEGRTDTSIEGAVEPPSQGTTTDGSGGQAPVPAEPGTQPAEQESEQLAVARRPGRTTADSTLPTTNRTGRVAVAVPALEVDRASAEPGNVLAFTASGLAAGRQVTAVLDDGEAGAGPFTVGADGQLSGLLQLPAGITSGTHELRLHGAVDAEEDAPAVRFAVLAGAADADPAWWQPWQPTAFAAAGALALLAALVVLAGRGIRRRRRTHA